jgi:hypothetical protein
MPAGWAVMFDKGGFCVGYYMKKIKPLLSLCCALLLATTSHSALGASWSPLLVQVEHLAELLRDPYAEWYPEGTMVQEVPAGDGSALALVVFTLEGFGRGNNHTQYFAVFSVETDEEGGPPHYALLDALPIAGKGWRGVMDLNARVTRAAEQAGTHIALDALAVTEDDAPNFPSQPMTIRLLLKGGRLAELSPRG